MSSMLLKIEPQGWLAVFGWDSPTQSYFMDVWESQAQYEKGEPPTVDSMFNNPQWRPGHFDSPVKLLYFVNGEMKEEFGEMIPIEYTNKITVSLLEDKSNSPQQSLLQKWVNEQFDKAREDA